jgi:hypothetical protein
VVSVYHELVAQDGAIASNVNVTNCVLAAMGAVNPHQALDFFAELRAKGQVDDRSYCAVLEVNSEDRQVQLHRRI